MNRLSRNCTAIRLLTLAGLLIYVLLGSQGTLSADDSLGRALPRSLTEHGLIDQLMSSDSDDAPSSPINAQFDRLVARRVAPQDPMVDQLSAPVSATTQRPARVGHAYYAKPTGMAVSEQALQPQPQGESASQSRRHKQSFIDEFTAKQPQARETGTELIRRLGVNLFFVLACATGFLLVIKQWRTSKQMSAVSTPERADSIKISQVRTLSNGASLQVVEVIGNQFLVAIDSTGIRSVKPLVQGFDQTLERSASYEPQRQRAQPEPVVHDESTAEIDANLIRLLLNSSKRAA